MLPRLVDEEERDQVRRPSLPSIHDLFGDHLAQPIKRPPPFVFPPPRSSPFSLRDLGSSLPTDSRPSSPAESQGSLLSSLASPRSAWSQTPGYYGSAHGWPSPYSPRRHSDASAHLVTTPSTSSNQDQFITLPPIQKPYEYSHSRDRSDPNLYMMQTTSSSRRLFENHGRSRSSSEAIVTKEAPGTQHSSEIVSKRRHTIGSSRGTSALGFSYPAEPMPNRSIHNSSQRPTSAGILYAPRPSVKNPYPTNSPHTSTRGLNSSPVHSPVPSPPSTASGEEAPTERRKSPAKYQCQYCGKRFNRPSSLKIHNNTHTGEKPFACSFPGCGRHFSVMSNMRRHARIHGETAFQTPREGSVEEALDMPSPAYSSSSSTYNTPIISSATLSAYPRSYPSSASPSPRLRAMSYLPSSRPEDRHHHSTAPRHHPYRVSPSHSSDEEESSSEH